MDGVDINLLIVWLDILGLHTSMEEGLTSTSHIEALWANLKSIIKNSYHIIPSKKFISFLKEAEFKIKIIT